MTPPTKVYAALVLHGIPVFCSTVNLVEFNAEKSAIAQDMRCRDERGEDGHDKRTGQRGGTSSGVGQAVGGREKRSDVKT